MKERVQSAQLLERPSTVGPPSFWYCAQDWNGSLNARGVPSGLRGKTFSSACWSCGYGEYRPLGSWFRLARTCWMLGRLGFWG
ncbi:hypothetical protein, partial [Streptomyces rimosus]|uniref:hypothetical protein n=1 Tax=Streptomyces rimosus TaxID=1927 RepID=UPI001F252CEC